MSESPIVELVDAMLARSEQKSPGVEFTITVSREMSLLLPRDDDKVWREVDGRTGFYRAHAYRDRIVEPLPQRDWLIMLSPCSDSASAPIYYGDLRTGDISTTVPADALYDQGH